MAKRRLMRNKHCGMTRRLVGVKKPMKPAEKEANKKKREAQRAASKAALEVKKQ